jgi:hypothetical protein
LQVTVIARFHAERWCQVRNLNFEALNVVASDCLWSKPSAFEDSGEVPGEGWKTAKYLRSDRAIHQGG